MATVKQLLINQVLRTPLTFSVTENKKPVRLCVVGIGGYITGIAELTPVVGATPKGHGLYIKELKIEI